MDNKSNKIREQRKVLAYSIKELSNLTSISDKDIIAYETNKKAATLKTLKRIAKATDTNVSDWVDEDYFRKSESVEKVSDKDNREIAIYFLKSLFGADDVMKTIYIALIDMKEMEVVDNKEIIFSEFSKELLKSATSIKLKKVFKACGKDLAINNINTEICYTYTDKKKLSLERANLNGLENELRVLFKNTDIIEVIIHALINIGHINNEYRSEKATLLLNTIMLNKIKNSLVEKEDQV